MLDEGPSTLAGYCQIVRIYAPDLIRVYHLAPVPVTGEERRDAGEAFGGVCFYQPLRWSGRFAGSGEL
jgi:hypothetical protein